ncbi:MAG: ribonuclease H-like domain-containing protein [Nitrososphaerales archaeon]
MSQPKILLLDIETAPAIAYVWTIWETNIGINQIIKDGYVICWSAKWLGSKEVMSDSVHKYCKPSEYDSIGEKKIALSIWKLLDQADIVVTHNGDSFDLKWLNGIFIKHGIPPLPAVRSIDTLKEARKVGRFISNKLDFLVRKFKLGQKISTGGFELWDSCLVGQKLAWDRMLTYCKHDTRLLEKLYLTLKPYIKNHPNLALITHPNTKGVHTCPACGSDKVQKKGFFYTNTGKYQRFRCDACGKNARSTKAESRTGLVSA